MTDITELAQLRGRTVDYPYYLVECDCGKIYPSSELSGGEPMGDSGDYSDCYCTHCGEGEEHFAECADPETAWKAQQDKIDALVEALENSESRLHEVAVACATAEQALEKAQQRIAEMENNEIQEEGSQFLVVRHPGKVPVIKHPVGELEDYLRQMFKADPLATIDIVTHRYYGVGGQFVVDADEYLHVMSIKVEAE